MHPNAALIAGFYSAFQRREAPVMGAAYSPDAVFEDPVFSLHGWRVPAMWAMLCERATDLRITFGEVRADDAAGSASWEAWYTFSGTGRPVHNRIQASFRFAGGRILEHRDSFDLWRWAGQALGLKGRLLGWAGPVQATIRRQAARALDRYCQERGLTGG
jgi:ketosteroid isomerase-like protein